MSSDLFLINQQFFNKIPGGPLQISNEDNVKCTYMQVGIVSYGSSDCGSINVPGNEITHDD